MKIAAVLTPAVALCLLPAWAAAVEADLPAAFAQAAELIQKAREAPPSRGSAVPSSSRGLESDSLERYLSYPEVRRLPREDPGASRLVGRFRPEEFSNQHWAALPLNLGFGDYHLGLEVNAGNRTAFLIIARGATSPILVLSHGLERLIANEAHLVLKDSKYQEDNDYYVHFERNVSSLLSGKVVFEPAWRGNRFSRSLQDILRALAQKGREVAFGGKSARLFLYADHDLTGGRTLLMLTASECRFKAYALAIPADLGAGEMLRAVADGVELTAALGSAGAVELHERTINREAFDDVTVCPLPRPPDTTFPKAPSLALEYNLREIAGYVTVPPPIVSWQDDKTAQERMIAAIAKDFKTRKALRDFEGNPLEIVGLGAYALGKQKMGELVPDLVNTTLREPKRWLRERVGVHLDFLSDSLEDRLPERIGGAIPDSERLTRDAFDRPFDNGLRDLSKLVDKLIEPIFPTHRLVMANPDLPPDLQPSASLLEKINNGMASETDLIHLRAFIEARRAPAGKSKIEFHLRPRLGLNNPGAMLVISGPLDVKVWAKKLTFGLIDWANKKEEK